METCVLIPPEFSLILTQDSSQDKVKNDNNNAGPKKRKFFYEMGVRVWSNQSIPQGTRFMPFNGTIRLDKLEVYSTLDDSDIRQQYGCYDDIQEVDGQTVRHCNWIRFLRVANSATSQDVNLVGSKVSGEPMYEIVKTVKPNTELVVYYDESGAHQRLMSKASKMIQDELGLSEQNLSNQENITKMTPEQYKYTMNAIIEDSPLDLSLSLLSSRILITPPSDSEDSKCSEPPPSPSDKSDSLTMKGLPDMKTGRRGRERHMLPCEVCGKAFDRPSLLRRHMRTHTGEKPHVCDVCGKGFSTSSSLNTHRRIHSGEKPHQCPVCGKRFTASSNLYYHRMTHNKEKPHKCKLCSKSFPTPGDLKSHMYVHNGSWPYKCNICNRGFSKQTNLRNHLFLHTGDKPHQCNVCQKRFALACNLRAHLKTHDSPPQEDCLKCGRRIPSSKNECSSSGLCSGCIDQTAVKSDRAPVISSHYNDSTPKAISAQEALASLAKNEQYLRQSNYPGLPSDLHMFYPTSRPLTSTPLAAAPHIFPPQMGLLRSRSFFHIT